jgi:site-specific recombinase XerD
VPGDDEDSEPVAVLPVPLRRALETYATALAAADLSDSTRRVYRSRVSNYLAWLAAQSAAAVALTDPHRRNAAVRDYQDHLRTIGRADTAINSVRVALDDFYRRRGLGSAVAERRAATAVVPAPLTAATQQAVDAVLDQGPRAVASRRRAVVDLMRYAGLGGAEVAGLAVADVHLGGEPRVRVAGVRPRTVPVDPRLRTALRSWVKVRAQAGAPPDGALFPNRSGRHLSARAITGIVQDAGDRAGVRLSPAVLQATFAAALWAAGVEAAVVAALTGRRSATPMQPSPPSAATLRAAVRAASR